MKYETMKPEQIIFETLAQGRTITHIGKHKVLIGTAKIHYRFKSHSEQKPGKFPFNINPNSVDAQFELLICGDEELYYLIPVEIIKKMYSHPDGYIDKHHPNIRIIGIDASTNDATYAKPSIRENFAPYKNQLLRS